MFVINEDLSIYATRGDVVFFTVQAKDDTGSYYEFQAGDVLRMKIYGKKNAEKVYLEKDFPITANANSYVIYLDEEDTKIGDVISKATDYWYEIELNPYTNPQTIIGFDEDGAKIFKLFPEGADSEVIDPDPEDIPIVDDLLDMTSTRPVQNQAIARAIVNLEAAFRNTESKVTEQANTASANVAEIDKDLATERARIDNLVVGGTADDSELLDVRVGVDGNTYTSAGEAVRSISKGVTALVDNEHYFKNYLKICFDNKAVVNGSADIGSVMPLNRYEAENVYGCIISCKEGDTFRINADGHASDSRLWCFTDANNVCLSRNSNAASDVKRYGNPITIVAPAGAVKLSCNWLKTSPADAYICNVTEEEKRLDELENKDKAIAKYDTTKLKHAFPKRGFFKEFEAKSGYSNNMRYAEFYNLFHELYTKHHETTGLEEIDMSLEYLRENPSDSVPSYIYNIENGKMLLYKLPMLPRNNSGTTAKFKPVNLLLISGLHGSERKSIYNHYLLLNDLLQEQITDPCIQAIRSFCNVYIVPMVNPYGIENSTRDNANINLNRDFATNEWVAVADSSDVPNSQYETRVLSYWIDRIKPTCLIDHHTSSGSDETEWKFTHWGDSRIEAINSLIEENALDVTPYIRNQFFDKLGKYNFCFGNTADMSDVQKKQGMLTNYAHEKGYIACTFEVVMHLKWDGAYVFGYSEAEENDIVSINYFEYINYLLKFIRASVDILDSETYIK